MAENIVMLEWDIAQILIQKRHIARSAVFDEITNQYVKLAEKAFYQEERLRRLEDLEEEDGLLISIASLGDYEVFDAHEAKMTAREIITQFKSGHVDSINRAQVQIKADLPSPETILAVVFEEGSRCRALDEVLAGLERRRRRLLEDYKNLQKASAIDVAVAE